MIGETEQRQLCRWGAVHSDKVAVAGFGRGW